MQQCLVLLELELQPCKICRVALGAGIDAIDWTILNTGGGGVRQRAVGTIEEQAAAELMRVKIRIVVCGKLNARNIGIFWN